MLSADLSLIDVNPSGNPLYDKTVVVGDKLYFADTSPQQGWELKVHDTSTDTTSWVADINPGLGDSYAGQYGFGIVGTKLYFSAYDPTNGYELRWIDTAQAVPSVQTIDVNAGSGGSNAGLFGGFEAVGTKLYFTAFDPTNGDELRWIDTTQASPTVQTVDINPGSDSSAAGFDGGFQAVGEKLYFTASDWTYGNEPRWIDTTQAVPSVQTIDVYPGSDGSYTGDRGGYQAVGLKLYFMAEDPTNGTELRWIDTTQAAPTVQTIDTDGGTGGSDAGLWGGFQPVGTKLYFTASDATYGIELRWIDTTQAAPTVQTIDVYPGSDGSLAGLRGGFQAVGEKLYFTAYDATYGTEPRWIDTTQAAPSVQTIDVNVGSGDSEAGLFGGFRAVGSKLYFTAYDPTNDFELRWIDTAQAAPSMQTIDVNAGSGGSIAGFLGGFQAVGARLYFTAYDSTYGVELRWIDTTQAAPSVQTIDFYAGDNDSNPGSYGGFQAVGSKLYFTANDPINGDELRWIDTTQAAPSVQTVDIYAGSGNSEAGVYGGFRAVGSKLYFTAYDPTNGYELRWIDTTQADPSVQTIDIYAGSDNSDVGYYGGFQAVGSNLYFTAYDPTNGYELRWIDTTQAVPSVQTIDVYAGSASSDAGRYGGFQAVGSKLYFTAYDQTSGNELRWIDTAQANPIVQTIDIYAGSYSSGAGESGGFQAVGSKLYFTAYDPTFGSELRWIDTTQAVPSVQTVNVEAGSGGSAAGFYGGFQVVGTKLYFTAYDPTSGYELRWIDTTQAAPSVQTIEACAGSDSSYAGVYGFQAVGTKLYFTAYDPASGYELRWIDTTQAAPTVQTIDVNAGSGNSNAGELGGFQAVAAKLYFSAYDPSNGSELRWIDTTQAAPSVQTIDIYAGNFDSRAGLFGVVGLPNGDLYFSATKPGFGYELFRYRSNEGSLQATLNGGTLQIADGDAVGVNNDLALRLVNGGTDLEITDPNNAFSSTPAVGTLSADGKTLVIPAAMVDQIVVDAAGGADTLTVDLSGGDAIPTGGITFHGGDPIGGPGDALVITGGDQGTVTYNYTNAHDGSVVLSNYGTITYTGLEPITNSGTASDVIFNLPAGGNAAYLEDDGIGGNGGSRLRSNPDTFEATTFANPTNSLTVNRGNTVDTLAIGALPDFTANLTLGSAAEPFNTLTFQGAVTLAGDKSLAADAAGTISLSTSAADLTTSGNGSIRLTTARNIILSAGASMTTENGNLILEANQQASATAGDFIGIQISQAVVQSTGLGVVSVKGKGGDTGDAQYGVLVATSGIIRGGAAGTLVVEGRGGGSTDSHSHGVYVFGSDAIITSVGAAVQVTGQGGGAGATTQQNFGVAVSTSSEITAGGLGTVTVQGTGGQGTFSNYGVYVTDDALITSGGGSVDVQGQAGGTAGENYGVFVLTSGQISAGGLGSVSVQGTGGSGSGSGNHGVYVSYGAGAKITSSGGTVQVTGIAGGGANRWAIQLDYSAAITTAINGGDIVLIGDSMALDSTAIVAAAAANSVSVRPYTGIGINLGGNDANDVLGLTDAELQRISATTLHIGSSGLNSLWGSVPIAFPLGTNVDLQSGGEFDIPYRLAAFGDLRLSTAPGGAVRPRAAGDGVAAATLAFGSASTLAFTIDGAQAGSGYTQLVTFAAEYHGTNPSGDDDGDGVVNSADNSPFVSNPSQADQDLDGIGDASDPYPLTSGPNFSTQVDVSGVNLSLDGTYTPVLGESFTIVNNHGAGPIVGTFNGLAEGQQLLFRGSALRISYVGGDGNDVTLTAVNRAPTLAAGGDIALVATDEDTPSTATQFSDLLQSAGYDDSDAGALSGVAVVGSSSLGHWQYSTDGLNWTNFGAVSTSHALLLANTTRVRYVPDGLSGETASFTFRAWDHTSGTASAYNAPAYADPGTGGGESAYSSTVRTAEISVAPVNDPANITGTNTGSQTEDAPPAAASGMLSANDPDTGENQFQMPPNLNGVYGTFTFNPAAGAWTYAINNADPDTNALTAGQVVHDILNVTSFDGSDSETIDITITGNQDPQEDLVVDFGTSGLWTWQNNTAWHLIHSYNPTAVVSGDLDGNGQTDLVIDFGSTDGLWVYYNHTAWQKIHPYTTQRITTADVTGDGRDEAVIDFGSGLGTWIYTSSSNSWRFLTYTTIDSLVAADLDGNHQDELVVDFGAYGIYVYWNDTSWQFLHSYNPHRMVAGNLDGNATTDLAVDFGAGVGLWVLMNGANWQFLHSYTTTALSTGDLSGDGRDELVVDFATNAGTWERDLSAATWKLLTYTPIQERVLGDLDGNGQDELVTDLGVQGIYIYWNDSQWQFLHSYNPDALVMAQFEAPPPAASLGDSNGATAAATGSNTSVATTAHDQALASLLAQDDLRSATYDDAGLAFDGPSVLGSRPGVLSRRRRS